MLLRCSLDDVNKNKITNNGTIGEHRNVITLPASDKVVGWVVVGRGVAELGVVGPGVVGQGW